MTLQELNDWIKSAKRIDHTDEFTDECGNYEVTSIYEKDGKYYQIQFQNGHPYTKWEDGKGFIRGEYNYPREVKKISGMAYWEDWELVCE